MGSENEMVAVPEGMVAYGPDHPDYPNEPKDWDRGPYLARDGKMYHMCGYGWKHGEFSASGVADYDRIAYTPARLAPAQPDAQQGEDLDARASEYAAEYVMTTEGADYEPTEFERSLIEDALHGFLSEHVPTIKRDQQGETDAEVARIMALSDEEVLAEANVGDVAWARGFKQGLQMGRNAATPSSPALDAATIERHVASLRALSEWLIETDHDWAVDVDPDDTADILEALVLPNAEKRHG